MNIAQNCFGIAGSAIINGGFVAALLAMPSPNFEMQASGGLSGLASTIDDSSEFHLAMSRCSLDDNKIPSGLHSLLHRSPMESNSNKGLYFTTCELKRRNGRLETVWVSMDSLRKLDAESMTNSMFHVIPSTIDPQTPHFIY